MKIHAIKSLCLLATTYFLASAVSAGELKIGTVDVAKVFAEYYKARDASAKLQENATSAKEEMNKRLEAYKKLNDEAKALGTESQDAGLPADVRARKRTEMQSKVNDLRSLDKDIKEFQAGRSDQLKQDQAQQRKSLYDEILKVISEKTQVHGYDLVFDKSGVSASPMPFPLHAKESVTTTDFTPEVIAELNKNAPAGAANKKSPKSAETANSLKEVPFITGAKHFAEGDDIVIDKVMCSSSEFKAGDRVVVRGHYQLSSIPEAQLALYLTHTSPGVPEKSQPEQSGNVMRGSREFERAQTVQAEGSLHLSFYDMTTGKAIGGFYFGTQQQVDRTRNWYPEKSLQPGGSAKNEKQTRDDRVSAQGNAQAMPSLNAAPSSPRRPDPKDTYTITSTLELAKPFSLEDMNDPFQEARVISETADSCIVEITYYPLFRPEIVENPNWRKDYAGMTEYLRPTPTENWDEKMRTDLLAELRAAGIDPEQLTDKQLVEQVSRWAIRRTRTTDAFSIWALHYPEGKPTVFPPLRAAFERIQGKTGLTEQQMIDQEALGRSMYYGKVRGSCTSSSVYLTTIFRALGIPTRIVFCDPPFDPNDPKQAEMFYGAIRHHQVRETVRAALDGMTGSCNHLFNEVYVGGSWVRLNYSTLGQPILDSHYFGLLTHVLTTSDFSRVPVAETWGMRYFRYAEAQPRLSSVNPYRLIAVHDRFGENALVENPEVAAAELRTVTIVGLIRPGDKRVPESFAKSWQPKSEMNFLISAREWIPGTYRQMRAFEKRASHDFILTAPDHPELRARLTRLTLSKGDGAFQAYEAEVVPDDRAKVAPGVSYSIKPINSSETYRWQVAEDLAPVAFQD